MHSGNVTVENNLLTGNEALYSGGGIYSAGSQSDAMIAGNFIYENVGDAGGGLSFVMWSFARFVNNTVYRNTANGTGISGMGGGIAVSSFSEPVMFNNTIFGNTASVSGGGLCCTQEAKVNIKNTILWGDSAPIGKEMRILDQSSWAGATIDIDFSDIEGGVSSVVVDPKGMLKWGVNNIDANPEFDCSPKNDFHICTDSPCRNGGCGVYGLILNDFEGDPRTVQGKVDIGADEFYYHLYSVGNMLPGSPIDIKVVGIPGLNTILALGTGIQDPSQSTQHGDLWLKLPLAKSWQLGPIPNTGILTHTATVPSGWPSGSLHPFQALVGPWGGGATKLTNLMVLEVQ